MPVIPRTVCFLGALLVAGAAAAQVRLQGDPARGATLAGTCISCHGPAAGAPLPGTPALAGQQAEFLVLQMFLLREGLRDVPVMVGTLTKFADRDLTDIAAYFESQSPPVAVEGRDAARHARGAAISQAMGCGSCHMTGYSGQRQVPRLANQREDYLALALRAYRDNRRSGTDTSMNAVMYKVSDADIAALAYYLARQ